MATLQSYSSSSVILAALLVAVLFVGPSSSTSRHALQHQTAAHPAVGFRVTLRHIDSGKNLTNLERLQRAIERGKNRQQSLNARVSAASTQDSQIQVPTHAGNGDYLMDLSIGTPPEAFSAILDTGSDLIWTQCEPCSQCFQQPTPIFDPEKSPSFSELSCDDDLCSALPQQSCTDDNGCQYQYGYGDGSQTQGILATETFTFGGSGNQVSVKNIGFGCGEDNSGQGFGLGAGLVGLGRGSLSLVSQLNDQKFSYCLTSIADSKPSILTLGSLAGLNGTQKALTTPLVRNPSQSTFYYLSLQGISVGGTRLPIDSSTFQIGDDGSGGTIIDSGTTLTIIPVSAFDALRREFVSQTNLPSANTGQTGLDVCFTLPSGTGQAEFPSLVFHFEGADLELPVENYILGESFLGKKGLACLAVAPSSGSPSIFGNVQQQNYLVNYDLEAEAISFVPTQCDEL